VTISPAARARRRFAVTLLWLLLPLAAMAQNEVLDPEVFEIGRALRCPTCVAESVAESNAAVAQEMRRIIQEQLDAGRSRSEIIASFQASYGDWILQEPPARGIFLFVWLVPVAALVAAAAGLVVLTRRWRAAAEVPTAAPEELALVRAALASERGGPEASLGTAHEGATGGATDDADDPPPSPVAPR
jgi:cytochrome c-type biogenesis protein CcmH